MFHTIKNFLDEAHQELKRVNWPTRNEAIRLTFVVILISLGVAAFLGVFDFIFIAGLKYLLTFRYGY